MTYEITMRKPSELVPYAKNSRTHSAEQVKQVMRSIEEFGFTNPILTHGKTIIAGHCRLEAAKKLGYTEVPTIALDGLTKEQARAYVIADNKLALNAGWDDGILKDEIESLLSVDYAIDLLGFTDEELKDLGVGVEEPEEHSGDPDEVPEVPQNIHGVKRGDIWQLGEHRLMCGDSTNADDVARLMDGEKADMVFTDPPYNIAYGTSKNPKWGKKWNGNSDGPIANDNMSSDDFKTFCYGWAKSIEAVCDGCVYVWGPPGKDGRIMFTVLDEMFHNSTTIVWNKDRMTLGRGKYQNKYEPCWFGWVKEGKSFDESDRTITNVWDFKRPSIADLHPTMKPVELCEYGISHIKKTNGTVLDLFGGSGSTLIACERLYRKARLLEMNEHYCSVIIERWQQFTNKKAIRIEGE